MVILSVKLLDATKCDDLEKEFKYQGFRFWKNDDSTFGFNVYQDMVNEVLETIFESSQKVGVDVEVYEEL